MCGTFRKTKSTEDHIPPLIPLNLMHLRGCNCMVLKGPMGTIYIIHTHLINYIDKQMIAYVVFHSGNISSKGVCKRLQTFRSFSRAFNLQTLILKPGLKKCFSGLVLNLQSWMEEVFLRPSIFKLQS